MEFTFKNEQAWPRWMIILWIRQGFTDRQRTFIRPESIQDFQNLFGLDRDRLVFVRVSLDQGKLSAKNKAPLFARMHKQFILSKPSDYTTGKIIGRIVGDYLFDHRAVAKEMFNSIVRKRESRFYQNQVGCQQIDCPFRSVWLTKKSRTAKVSKLTFGNINWKYYLNKVNFEERLETRTWKHCHWVGNIILTLKLH